MLNRPVLALMCSLVVLVLGLVALPALPVAQYPTIAPPTVTVSAAFVGAGAAAVESSVTVPLEKALNKVQGLRYIASQSGSDGTAVITCTFDLERNLDQAANDVQNAVNLVQGVLPDDVRRVGVTVTKNSGALVRTVAFTSSDPHFDRSRLTDYLKTNVVGDIERIPGVAGVSIFGERQYALRLWLNPRQLAKNGLTVDDVSTALKAQNVQVGAGAIGGPPTNGGQFYEYGVRTTSRLHDAAEFENVVIRTTRDGGHVRVRDVARVTLGAETYGDEVSFNALPSVGLGIQQSRAGNALQISREVGARLARLAPRLPAGVHYDDAFDRSSIVRESIREVVFTLVLTVLVVVFFMYLFLQDWRATLIPAITIPVSLIGTFFAMKLFGFSLNTLTLFGLTLATGLVVDDAVVIVDNVERFIHDYGLPPLEATREAMSEIRGAVIASSLTLLAVFIPVAFLPGTTGLLYRQFALTIACSIAISLFNALTLAPVLAAWLLRARPERHGAFVPVNRAIRAMRGGYARALPAVLRRRRVVAVGFVCALVLTGWAYANTPTAFIQAEDQGFIVVAVQARSSYSIDQGRRVALAVERTLHDQPEIAAVFDDVGYSLSLGVGSNYATMFARLTPWGERPGAEHSAQTLLRRLNRAFRSIPDARVAAYNPSAVPGLGVRGGFAFQLEDRAGRGIPALKAAADTLASMAGEPGTGLVGVGTEFRTDKPTVLVSVDRDKALSLGVDMGAVYRTMQAYLGSLYVNDFDMAGQPYKVYLQADAPYRSRLADLASMYVPGTASTATDPAPLIPLSSLVRATPELDPPVITHFDLYRSIEVDGGTAPGYSSGQSIATMQRLMDRLPADFGFDWSGIAREEVVSGSQALLIFALGIMFVFCILAIQYESLTDPLVILLSVPLALLGACAGLWALHEVHDVFAQVGDVMLIGLATKNAILIVEVANRLRREGLEPVAAVTQAAQTRLRPIVMTSLAFVMGVTPLLFATGVGSVARHSLGTVVCFGMIVSTVLNLFIIPVLYVIIVKLTAGRWPRPARAQVPGPHGAQ